MIALLGAYVFWRVGRRLLPLVLIAIVALVLLSPSGHASSAAGQLRHDLQLDVRALQHALAGALQRGAGH
jgi:hypothetical protein